MAEATFTHLLDEQKKTTSSLDRLSKTLRQQLLGDKSQEKDERRVAAGNKAWQTRQEKAAGSQEKIDTESLQYDAEDDTYKKEKEYTTDPDTAGIDDDQWEKQHENMEKVLEASKGPYEALTEIPKLLMLPNPADEEQKSILERMADAMTSLGEGLQGLGKDTESASQRKESEKDTRSFTKKTFGKLGDMFKGGFKSLVKSLETFKSIAGAGFKAMLVALGLFALIEFLQSPTWKKIRDWIAENPLTGVLATVIAITALFFPILTLRLIGKAFTVGAKLLTKFAGWMKAKDIFGTFAKGGKVRNALIGMKEGIGKFGGAIGDSLKTLKEPGKLKNLLGGPMAKVGAGLAKFGTFFKLVGKVFVPLGLVIAIIEGIWGSFKAMVAKWKETGSLMETIETGISAFLGTVVGSILDFIKDIGSWLLDKFGNLTGWEWPKKAAKIMDDFSFTEFITEGFELLIDVLKDLVIRVKDYLSGWLHTVTLGFLGTEAKEDVHPQEAAREKAEEESKIVVEAREKKDKRSEEAYLKKREKELEESGEFTKENWWSSAKNKEGLTMAEQAAADFNMLVGTKGRKAALAAGDEPIEPLPVPTVLKETFPAINADPKKKKGAEPSQAAEIEPGVRLTLKGSDPINFWKWFKKGGGGQDLAEINNGLKDFEQKKAELKAAQAGGGGNITNIAQNNSTNMNSQTTRAENIIITDLEVSQVLALNI